MTDPASVTALDELFALPAAQVGPSSPRGELFAAADVLKARGDWRSGMLALWLNDTALLHGPDETGRRCERDGDQWPCHDVDAAQKVAFTIGYTTDHPGRDD